MDSFTRFVKIIIPKILKETFSQDLPMDSFPRFANGLIPKICKLTHSQDLQMDSFPRFVKRVFPSSVSDPDVDPDGSYFSDSDLDQFGSRFFKVPDSGKECASIILRFLKKIYTFFLLLLN